MIYKNTIFNTIPKYIFELTSCAHTDNEINPTSNFINSYFGLIVKFFFS